MTGSNCRPSRCKRENNPINGAFLSIQKRMEREQMANDTETAGHLRSTPCRVQLSRKKGWRMPPNTVSVARPTKWGNPWKIDAYYDAGFQGTEGHARQTCVDAFRAWHLRERHWAHGCNQPSPPDPTELRGKNLACWCPLDQPCHADVLLELANTAPAAVLSTLEESE